VNTDYKFDIGLFTLNGPLTQATIDCPMTAPCVVQVTGSKLAATNQAKVVANGVACTTAAAVPTVYTGGSFDVAVTNSNPFRQFDLGTTTAGPASSDYHLCWAHDSNYLFEVGSFQISGPYTGATECTLTETCSLQLTGVGLATSNVIRILESALACGGNNVGVNTFAGLASTTTVTNSGTYRVYAVATGETTAGTSGARYRLCWSHNPGANTDYSFNVGVFTLNGPLTMTNDCPMTSQCVVQLTGPGFA
jgi:hypothetical protein